jgi:glutamyl-tRNA reductase
LRDALEDLLGGNPINEGLIVSTCNRVEIIAASEVDNGFASLFQFLERYHGCEHAMLERHCYSLADLAAVKHIFRVTSSLDSMVVGEPQITGQVKEAFQVAQDARAVGQQLNRLMSRAFAVAKRVRNETGIGSSAVSVSFVAVELARRVFETLRGATVLLLGAGEMAELAARHLRGYGVARLLIANRTIEKAESLAVELQGEVIDFGHFEQRLAEADIVLCSTGAPHYLIEVEHVRQALASRRNRPMLLIDISVPRNVDPAIAELDNAFVFDVDDLENVVASNLQVREQEAQRAEAIIDAEAEKFVASLAAGDINEIIGEFRREVGTMVQSELERSRKRLGNLDPEQEEAIRVLLNSVVNRLTLPVIRQLRESDEGQSNYLELWREISKREQK